MGTTITFRRGENDPTSGSGLTLAEPAFNTTLKTFHIGLGYGVTAAWVGAPISGLSADIAAGITYKIPSAAAVKNYIGGLCYGNTGAPTITQYVSSFNGLTGAVGGVCAAQANTFTALQSFNSGVSCDSIINSKFLRVGDFDGVGVVPAYVDINSQQGRITSAIDGQDIVQHTTTLTTNYVQSNFLSGISASGITTSSLYVYGNAVVQGNMTVSGGVTFTISENVLIEDNIITLNSNVTGSPSENAGVEIERGASANVQLLWNESSDKWTFTNDGSTYYDLPTSVVTSFNGNTGAVQGVSSVNGSTGAITNVARTNVDNNFTEYQTIKSFGSGVPVLLLRDPSGYTMSFVPHTSFGTPNISVDSGSASQILQFSATASTNTVTLPNFTTTLAGLTGTQTFTGLKTFTGGLCASAGITFNGTVNGATATFSRLTTHTAGLCAAGVTVSGDIRFSGTSAKTISSNQATLTIAGVSTSPILVGSNSVVMGVQVTDSLTLNSATSVVDISTTTSGQYPTIPSIRILTDDADTIGAGSIKIIPASYATANRTQYLQDANGTIALTSQLMGAVNGSTAATTAVTSFNGSTGAVQGVSSFNGLTGAVGGVCAAQANTFTALQSFNSGISSAGGTFTQETRFASGLSASVVKTLNLSGYGGLSPSFIDGHFRLSQFMGTFTTVQSSGSTDRSITLPDADGTLALTSQLMGAVNGSTAATTAVTSFNGLTGAVTGVTVGGVNTFTQVNTFSAGISAAGSTFSSTTNTLDVIASTEGAGLRIARATSGVGSRIGGIRLGRSTTTNLNTYIEGSAGTFSLYNGVDNTGTVFAAFSTSQFSLGTTSASLMTFNCPNNISFGDQSGVGNSQLFSISGTNRTYAFGDPTGVTTGFVGINRSGLCGDYALEVNSPTGKGLQLIYNDHTGAASNWVNMDVSSGGNFTVRPSGGLATVTGTLNVSAGLCAAGGTFSSLTQFTAGLSASGTTAATLNGTVNFNSSTAYKPTLQYYNEPFTNPSINGNGLTLDLSLSQVFGVTLNANINTLTISNTPSTASRAMSFTLILTADGTARGVTWGSAVKWANGTPPTLTSTNAKKDVFTFMTTSGGSEWLGFVAGQNF